MSVEGLGTLSALFRSSLALWMVSKSPDVTQDGPGSVGHVAVIVLVGLGNVVGLELNLLHFSKVESQSVEAYFSLLFSPALLSATSWMCVGLGSGLLRSER